MREIRNFSVFAFISATLAGCAGDPNAPPMATDGPNQVVLKVPGMT